MLAQIPESKECQAKEFGCSPQWLGVIEEFWAGRHVSRSAVQKDPSGSRSKDGLESGKPGGRKTNQEIHF